MDINKQAAIKLRKEGKSYNEINKILNIPKSTLSSWLKDMPISNEIKVKNIKCAKIIRAKNITEYNKKRAEKARLEAIKLQKNACEDIRKLNATQLKLIGTALYWAEGYNRAKWNALFCNSDPQMVKLMMRFFREICHVPDEKFRPQVQIHNNVSQSMAETFWSKISGLNVNNFRKPLKQISKSSKGKMPIHRLPYGTFRVGIADAKVLYRLKGWIEGLAKRNFLASL